MFKLQDFVRIENVHSISMKYDFFDAQILKTYYLKFSLANYLNFQGIFKMSRDIRHYSTLEKV